MLINIVLIDIKLKDDVTDEFGIYCTDSWFIIEDIKWYVLSYNAKSLFVKLRYIMLLK